MTYFNEVMGKIELLEHMRRLWPRLWWKLMRYESVVLPWPKNAWTVMDHLGTQIQSSDPNDHWRPWLEENVGRQGWDWDWRLVQLINGYDHVEVGFRRGKTDAKTAFALRWF